VSKIEEEYELSKDRMVLCRSHSEWRHLTAQSLVSTWCRKDEQDKEAVVSLSWEVLQGWSEDGLMYEAGFISIRSREPVDQEYLPDDFSHRELMQDIETDEIWVWKPEEYSAAKRVFLTIINDVSSETTNISVVDNRKYGGRVIIKGIDQVRAFFEGNQEPLAYM